MCSWQTLYFAYLTRFNLLYPLCYEIPWTRYLAKILLILKIIFFHLFFFFFFFIFVFTLNSNIRFLFPSFLIRFIRISFWFDIFLPELASLKMGTQVWFEIVIFVTKFTDVTFRRFDLRWFMLWFYVSI